MVPLLLQYFSIYFFSSFNLTMAVIKTKPRKKRRISKHISKAKGVKVKDGPIHDDEDVGETPNNELLKGNHKMKDPQEVATYLTHWKNDRAKWKYNKNTQSWILRHMYEGEKVSKATFTVLLEYLATIKGETTIQRVANDAIRRAVRFKTYLAKQQEREHEDCDKETTHRSYDDSETNTLAVETVSKVRTNNLLSVDDEQVDALRWNALDEHSKRKEYKRARKVLDTLKGREKD